MQPLDLLLVVGMFLTGFDAKKLNTLYVDKIWSTTDCCRPSAARTVY